MVSFKSPSAFKTSPRCQSDYWGCHGYLFYFNYAHQLVKDKSSLNGAKTPQTFDTDRDTEEMMDLVWPGTDASWLQMTSFGLRRILKYIKDHYGNVRIIITENSCTQVGERSWLYRIP